MQAVVAYADAWTLAVFRDQALHGNPIEQLHIIPRAIVAVEEGTHRTGAVVDHHRLADFSRYRAGNLREPALVAFQARVMRTQRQRGRIDVIGWRDDLHLLGFKELDFGIAL